jgi:O-antigen ligase
VSATNDSSTLTGETRWLPVAVSLLPVVCGVVVGIIALQVPVEQLRWALAALVLVVGMGLLPIIRHRYRLHLGVLVFSLQLCLWITLFYEGTNYFGRSGASALELYLSSMIAGAAFLARYPQLRASGQAIRWGREITKPALILAVPVLLSVLGSPERKISVFTIINWMQWYLTYFVALNLIRTEADLRFVTKMLMVVTIVQPTIYAIEYATGVTITLTGEAFERAGEIARHGGTVGTHPSTFAEFMNLLFFPSAALFLAPGNTKLPRWSAFAAIAGGAGVLMSFTRAAWIGCTLGVIVLVVTGVRRGWIKGRRLWSLAAAGLVLAVVFTPQIMLVFAKDHQEAFDERVMLQDIAINVIKAHPFIGVGIGAYSNSFRSYVSANSEDSWLFVVHNVYLLRAAEIGIFGMLAFVAWLWAAIRLAHRRMDDPVDLHARLGLGCMAAFVTIAFQFWWDTGAGFAPHALQWFLLGMLSATQFIDAPENVEVRPGTATATIVDERACE